MLIHPLQTPSLHFVSQSQSQSPAPSKSMAYIVSVQLFPKPSKRELIFEALIPEEKFVRESEDFTSAYYFFKPEDDPNLALGIEFYPDRKSLHETHMGSEPFKSFAAKLPELVAKDFVMEEFAPANVGFLARPEFSKYQSPDIYILLVNYTFKPGMRDTVLSWMAEIAQDVTDNEPTCYSYFYAKSLENPDKILIFERYANRSAFEDIHREAAVFKKVFARMEKEEVVVERKVWFCTEGLGFLARD
ncbi:hypothetical protein V1512DRAFT_256550 [Lipomyces arxii]|uniref:uncharacterized protein n=1 Tax=Lipomyces arxii TaxID=56418 RepID=UPI0034CE13A0